MSGNLGDYAKNLINPKIQFPGLDTGNSDSTKINSNFGNEPVSLFSNKFEPFDPTSVFGDYTFNPNAASSADRTEKPKQDINQLRTNVETAKTKVNDLDNKISGFLTQIDDLGETPTQEQYMETDNEGNKVPNTEKFQAALKEYNNTKEKLNKEVENARNEKDAAVTEQQNAEKELQEAEEAQKPYSDNILNQSNHLPTDEKELQEYNEKMKELGLTHKSSYTRNNEGQDVNTNIGNNKNLDIVGTLGVARDLGIDTSKFDVIETADGGVALKSKNPTADGADVYYKVTIDSATNKLTLISSEIQKDGKTKTDEYDISSDKVDGSKYAHNAKPTASDVQQSRMLVNQYQEELANEKGKLKDASTEEEKQAIQSKITEMENRLNEAIEARDNTIGRWSGRLSGDNANQTQNVGGANQNVDTPSETQHTPEPSAASSNTPATDITTPETTNTEIKTKADAQDTINKNNQRLNEIQEGLELANHVSVDQTVLDSLEKEKKALEDQNNALTQQFNIGNADSTPPREITTDDNGTQNVGDAGKAHQTQDKPVETPSSEPSNIPSNAPATDVTTETTNTDTEKPIVEGQSLSNKELKEIANYVKEHDGVISDELLKKLKNSKDMFAIAQESGYKQIRLGNSTPQQITDDKGTQSVGDTNTNANRLSNDPDYNEALEINQQKEQQYAKAKTNGERYEALMLDSNTSSSNRQFIAEFQENIGKDVKLNQNQKDMLTQVQSRISSHGIKDKNGNAFAIDDKFIQKLQSAIKDATEDVNPNSKQRSAKLAVATVMHKELGDFSSGGINGTAANLLNYDWMSLIGTE